MNENRSAQNIEAIYPLSPMQQGMLFHILRTPELGEYFTQWTCLLSLDLPAFLHAWQQVIDNYAVLRTAFVWQGIEEPMQVVGRKAKFSYQEYDWRTLPPLEQEAEMEKFLTSDRQRGFDLSRAPLLRLTFMRISEEEYWFTLSLSHLLLDGWSLNLILEEVFARYRNQKRPAGQSRPYSDYIAWLQKQDLQKAEAFWRQALKGFSRPVCLPTVEVTGQMPEGTGEGEQHLRFSRETTIALQSLASRNQLTFNTLIQGAWALLLSRYSGEDDVAFGVVVSGRPGTLAGVESMVGLFINTLPLRIQVHEGMHLLPWLKQLQNQQVDAREYEYSSLAQIQTWSEVPRGQALFQSILSFENYAIDISAQKQEEGLKIHRPRLIDRSNYPLTLAVIPGTQLLMRVLYDRGRFDAATITRMLRHLQTLLEGFVASPEAQLSALPMLTTTEQEQVLRGWNAPLQEPPNQQWVPDLFEQQARRTPDAIALVCGDQQMSYHDLDRRASALAALLQERGVGPDVVVALCVERGPHWLLGLLAILKAGGAYLPLDPALPLARLHVLLRDSQPGLLLTRQSLLPLFADCALPQQCLEPLLAAPCLPAIPPRQLWATSLAYVIYTSGSTGQPKGTLLTHQGFANLALSQGRRLGIEREDRVLQFASPSFDASLSEVVLALLWGATLSVPDAQALLVGDTLLGVLEEQAITTLTLPPSTVASLPAAQLSLPQLPHLRRLLLAGEAWSGALLGSWTRGRWIYNAYGPSEASVCATMSEWREGEERPVLGAPLANTQVYVLDGRMRPVPAGVVGELYLGGVGLARGYGGQPGQTAERFVPDPFSGQAGSRLYRTGDLSCIREGGEVEYRGRQDQQVKVRGYRIELGENEHALRQYGGVKEAVVVREEVGEQSRLVAYVEGEEGREVKVEEVRAQMQQWLPGYVLPSGYVVCERLPRTSSGKVDRRALSRGMEGQREERREEGEVTEMEERVREIWREVLGLERIGVRENFFEIGGHSLLAVRVLARMREAMPVDLTLDLFFEAPTIAGLASTLEQLYQQEQGNRERVAQLLRDLEQLSDDEVMSRLLREKTE